MLERFQSLFQGRDAKSAARAKLDAVRPRRGEVAIDCGANVGHITARLARSGGTVYAFEPNPHAFAELKKRVAARPNVIARNEAVYDAEGSMRLFLHEHSEDDPVKWSTGSSLVADKANVDVETGVEVPVIDLAAFIGSLERPVRVLKMDVEGAEVRILDHLIDTGMIDRIDHVFVEMHDHRIASLREPTAALRRRIAERGLASVHLDWP